MALSLCHGSPAPALFWCLARRLKPMQQAYSRVWGGRQVMTVCEAGAQLVPVVALGTPRLRAGWGSMPPHGAGCLCAVPCTSQWRPQGFWTGLSRDVLPADQHWHHSLLVIRLGTGPCSQTPFGKTAGLEGRAQLQGGTQTAGTPGISQKRYAGCSSGTTASAQGLWMEHVW